MPLLKNLPPKSRERVAKELTDTALACLDKLHSAPAQECEASAHTAFMANFYSTAHECFLIEDVASAAHGVSEGRVAQHDSLRALMKLYREKAELSTQYNRDCTRWIFEGWAPPPIEAIHAQVRKVAENAFADQDGPFASLPLNPDYGLLVTNLTEDSDEEQGEEEEDEEEESDEGEEADEDDEGEENEESESEEANALREGEDDEEEDAKENKEPDDADSSDPSDDEEDESEETDPAAKRRKK